MSAVPHRPAGVSAKQARKRARDEARPHPIETPEGVSLSFEIASGGDRAIAFLLDMLIITAASMAVVLLAMAAIGGSAFGSLLGAFVILLLFGLRTFYFIWFELRWQGATPGKRYVKLRVIDRHGGALRGEAVFARNLMREVEVFLPLGAIAAPEQLWPGAGGPVYLLLVAWFLILAFMPVFNRQRLRVGDMVGGTIVVRSPKALLLPDLAAARPATRLQRPAPAYTFAPDQLEVYGNYELQVLEEVLRARDAVKLQAVAQAICEKIGWTEAIQDVPEFLQQFYVAQRARLEQKMLLGKRQDYKKPDPRGRPRWNG